MHLLVLPLDADGTVACIVAFRASQLFIKGDAKEAQVLVAARFAQA
jgi:hypothetical protein